MLNLQLKTVTEMKDELTHDLPCYYIRPKDAIDSEQIDFVLADIEWVWVEYDQNDDETGTTTRFTEEDEGWKIGDRMDNVLTYDILEIRIDGYFAKEHDFLIISEEEFKKAMSLHLKK